MKTFKIVLGAIWYVGGLCAFILSIINLINGDIIRAIYHLLFLIFLLLLIKK